MPDVRPELDEIGWRTMRLLAASDIHGNHDFYRWIPLLVQESKVDAVVLAGDLLGFLDGYDTVEDAQDAEAQEIERLLAPLPVPLFYIMGNDDWIDLKLRAPAFQSLQGRRLDLGAYNLVGYQYSLPFMGGVFEKPEAEIAADLALLRPQVDSHTVLVTHSPARGILDTTQVGPAGSVSILELVNTRDVRAHIHGHIHKRFGRSGRHFNVASGLLMRAMVIDLGTMDHQVVTSGRNVASSDG